MRISTSLALYILYVFIAVDIVLIIINNMAKVYRKRLLHKSVKISSVLSNFDLDSLNFSEREFIKKNILLFVEKFVQLSQSVVLAPEAIGQVETYLADCGIVNYYIKNLKSKSKYKRMEAAHYLAYIPAENSGVVLEEAILREKNYVVKIYLAYALINKGCRGHIAALVSTLVGAPNWYQKRMYCLLNQLGGDFYQYILQILQCPEPEIKKLIISFAATHPAQHLYEFLLKNINSEDSAIAEEAITALAELYPEELIRDEFLFHSDEKIRTQAIAAAANFNSKEILLCLMDVFKQYPESEKEIVSSVSKILRDHSQYLKLIEEKFHLETDFIAKRMLAEILSNRIEYFLTRLVSSDREPIKNLLREIILNRKVSSVIGFLNKNNNVEIENEILSVLKQIFHTNTDIKQDFCIYLNERILQKLGEEKRQEVNKRQQVHEQDKSKIVFLYLLIIPVILVFPALHVVRHWQSFNGMNGMTGFDHLIQYIIDFNYYLAYYSIAINSIYLIMLVLSYIGVKKQSKLWRLKAPTLLFKKNMLPGISIIAPAYNESATIIESINSLLNLKYPDYELVVINDGSSDETLNVLINYFELEKVDFVLNQKLKTRPIRGIYVNRYIPKLIVVDKANGGKADSLNAGINVSQKDYFCGIDADSLLEPDALLKLSSLVIDEKRETVALGGNIFPVNGCTVDKGMLTEVHIPQETLARFQMVEYLRAFMAGRIGWALINSLLIISGAFGLFKKDRIIEIGGYLTSSERYKKDTVGEDMELVVRVGKHMRQNKRPYKINYAFNANCWTEVPEDLKILSRQRDRWQRGLIDIISFHRKILFNPSYGTMGLFSFPYFFLFEMIGPLVETQGYIMVGMAALIGLLNIEVALLLFISNILMGTCVSLASLIIGETDEQYFSQKEILILIIYAIIENFGFRQIASFWRVAGYINSLKKPRGWGEMTRKGFAAQTTLNN